MTFVFAKIVPTNASAITAATSWIEAVLTGSVATGLATLAIAGVGFGLLAGRVELRRAAQVVVGCFILFGAPVLVRELTGALRGNSIAVPDMANGPSVSPPPAPRQPPGGDPYAGAAVPME
jgi:type IV secretory pathway VirB2 component (pilin)